MKRFRRLSVLALAIFALAIVIAVKLPMQKAELPMQKPTALAIPTPKNTKLPTQTPAALAIVDASQSLHVRTNPYVPARGMYGKVTGYVYRADTVTLTGRCVDGWAQIQWKGAVAWVNARYLSANSCQTNKEW